MVDTKEFNIKLYLFSSNFKSPADFLSFGDILVPLNYTLKKYQ